jgi:hypothetical protein
MAALGKMQSTMYEPLATIESSLPLGVTLPEYRRARCAARARRRTLLRRLAGAMAS